LAEIFLSYNREDQAIADRFVRGFEAVGLSVWWDQRLRAGEAYDEVTEAALRNAKAVVVLWSKRSVRSRWVRAEATLAQRGGTFVPCMIEPCDRPIMFELTQTEDLSNWSGDLDDPIWKAIVAHVRDVVGKGDETLASAIRPAQQTQSAPIRPMASERRPITFMSATLADGDRLAANVDPEDWHDFLTELESACQPAIERFAGRASWRGHNVTVTYGFPQAMEDGAQRAVRTAREILGATEQVKLPGRKGADTHCKLKIGIHSSDMLVNMKSGAPEFIGDGATISEGARDNAPPGTILVTRAINSLASSAFAIEKVAESFHEQELFRVSDNETSSGTTRGWETGIQTGFVGREDELAHLRRRWKRALDEEGQFVLIRGEPGIGKSRLVEEFRAEIEEFDHAWFTLQGSSLFPNTPYYALGQAVQQAIEGEAGDPIDALGKRLDQLGFPPELLALLAPAIGLENQDGETSASAGDAHRSQLLSSLANAIFELSSRQPVILCLDDLQWFDPSTLELTQMLVEQGDNDRLLIIGTARPEFEPPWSERDHHSRINLSRLSKSEVKELIAEASGEDAIDPQTLQAIMAKADGVPLFAEELAKIATRQELGEGGRLPPTLRSLLAARMDRLGPARELLQLCSVLGSCGYPVLAAMTELSASDLDAQLRHLTEEQLLNVRGAPPHSNYRFKHGLLKDGAYETLTRKRRKQLHEEAANTIVQQFPELAEREKELVATHWTQAGDFERAVAAWLEAGQKEFERGASREAAAHLRQGLELVGELPEGPERDEQEMELWSVLNNALQQSLGYSNPKTIEAADRATELAKQLGLLGKVIVGEVQLWRGTITDGNYEKADDVAKRINELAQNLVDEEELDWMPIFSTNAFIQTAYYNGRLREFEEPYAELEKLFAQHNGMFSVNDDVVAMGVGSLAAWAMGRSSLARQRIAQAVEVAEGSGQPYAVAVAHHFAGTMMAFDRDMDTAKEHTDRALEVCDRNGIEFIGNLVRAKSGWLINEAAPSVDNILAMRQILEVMEAYNLRVGMVINMNRLAMALEVRGEIEEAYQAACQALEANPQERIVRPETYQIKARLEGKLGREDEAEQDFRRAITLADDIGAMAFQLSASVELAQFLTGQDRNGDALAVLTQVLDQCAPNIDTPALVDAKALHEKLTLLVA
jgi:class 3 adenylate cyclase/tetratricopeptide (TPR) repeat protein